MFVSQGSTKIGHPIWSAMIVLSFPAEREQKRNLKKAACLWGD